MMASFTRTDQSRDVTRIGLFGLFGCGNSGNDGSLEALVTALQRIEPAALLTCYCSDPAFPERAHGIQGRPFSSTGARTRFGRLIERTVPKVFRLFAGWRHALHEVRRLDLLIVPGTGILDDFRTGPAGMPYTLFRWSVAAWLCRRPVWLVSIGAGPIRHPLSRWLMKRAAGSAAYRSYRDAGSRQFMEGIGLPGAATDPVYPDLAFGLPEPALKPSSPDATMLTVGLGVMSYEGWSAREGRDRQVFESYIRKLTSFALWLLDQGHRLRLVTGDRTDLRAIGRLAETLGAARPALVDRITAEPTTSLHELMSHLAETDVVVATRYHNIVCAAKLCRPMISLGYAAKNDAILSDMGLAAFCRHVEQFEVDELIGLFRELTTDLASYRAQMVRTNRLYKARLAEQERQLAARLQHGLQTRRDVGRAPESAPATSFETAQQGSRSAP